MPTIEEQLKKKKPFKKKSYRSYLSIGETLEDLASGAQSPQPKEPEQRNTDWDEEDRKKNLTLPFVEPARLEQPCQNEPVQIEPIQNEQVQNEPIQNDRVATELMKLMRKLDANEYKLYQFFCLKTAGTNKTLQISADGLAAETGMSESTARRSRDALISGGLVKMGPATPRFGNSYTVPQNPFET